MSKKQAVAFLGYMIGRLGGGYHPDNQLSEYVDRRGMSSFTAAELSRLQPVHDQMMGLLGDDVYTICLDISGLVR